MPVASSAPARGRDETLFNWSVPPACRAGRRHRQRRQRPLTLMKLVRCRSNGKARARASDDVLRGSARVAPSRPVLGSALPLEKKNRFARSDKSTLCIHKTGRWEKATGGPGPGDPARPRAGRFIDAQCVLILRAREHRPRRRAPVRPHFANLEKMGARIEEVCPLRGKFTTPALSRRLQSRRPSGAV